MTASEKQCAACGNPFTGRADARFCGAACRKRASRSGTASRDRRRVTDRTAAVTAVVPPGRSAEAAALMSALDAELAANSTAAGLVGSGALRWTATEKAIIDQAADVLDRKADFVTMYRDSDDAKIRLKLSGEIRLLEGTVVRLLKTISTELPAAQSLTSQKAARAANARWSRRK